jgi:putative colanic acid biosynthesis acetyltransferase WcaF
MNLKNYSNEGFIRGIPLWKESLWCFARSLIFASWLPIPSMFKVIILRLFGSKVGRGVVIRSRVNITMPWKLEVGDFVWIGDETLILSLDRVTIGSNVCISQRSFLCTGSHDFSKESFNLITKPIVIAEGSWVGAQSFVGPGVMFGTGSRCLAGSVVVQNVECGSIVGGVPARPKKVSF